MAYDRSHMRIGDAERTRVAEALGKHFADGRLDKPEFDERMEKAMSAKTEADLAGLLADLPRLDDQSAPVPEVAVRPPVVRRAARVVLLAAVAVVLLRWLVWWPWHIATPLLIWPLVILVVLALLRRRRCVRK
jgi:Flp pilus assembly protein TadB